MTTEEEKKFRLYPRKEDYEDGEWALHNSDPFFYYNEPEWLLKMIEQGFQLKGIKRDIRGTTIDFVECIHHGDCLQVMVQQYGKLELHELLCDKGLQDRISRKHAKLVSNNPDKNNEFLLELAEKEATIDWEREILEFHREGEIVSASFLQKKLNTAKPSSPFYHPFEQFDRVDEPTKPIAWTVEGVIPDQSLISFHGDRESLKSFCALHLALCVSTGTDFFGHKTRQGPVLYLAPEGSTGLGVRRDAWLKENDWFGCYVPFYKRGGSFSFTNSEDRNWLADELNRSRVFQPRLVIFDTLGQSLGDADENSASDINRIARYLNDLKIAHDCSFLWIDHSGHDGNRARGSSAKGAALDAEFLIKRKGDQITFKNTKMKDAPRAEPLFLQAKPKHGSLILEQATPEPTHADVLIKVISEAQDHTETAIRQSFYEACTANTSAAKQKAFQRALDKLVTDGFVCKSSCEKDGELVLKTTSGHTHPPL